MSRDFRAGRRILEGYGEVGDEDPESMIERRFLRESQ